MLDLFMLLVSMFITGPLQSSLTEQLSQARAPAAIIAQVQECATTAAPALATRAVEDPWWGITTVAGIALGMTDPRPIIAATSPTCAAALTAAEPLLKGQTT